MANDSFSPLDKYMVFVLLVLILVLLGGLNGYFWELYLVAIVGIVGWGVNVWFRDRHTVTELVTGALLDYAKSHSTGLTPPVENVYSFLKSRGVHVPDSPAIDWKNACASSNKPLPKLLG